MLILLMLLDVIFGMMWFCASSYDWPSYVMVLSWSAVLVAHIVAACLNNIKVCITDLVSETDRVSAIKLSQAENAACFDQHYRLGCRKQITKNIAYFSSTSFTSDSSH